MLLLLCNWPPVCEECPNYDVAVFQPQTVTPPHLGSVAFITKFISSPPAPHDCTILWIIIFLPPSYRPPIRSPSSSYPYICLHPLLTSSPGAKRQPPGCRPHPPPASLCHSYLRPTPCTWVFRHVPWLCDPPFSALSLLPAPCQLLVFFHHGSIRLPCAPTSPSLSAPMSWKYV